MPSFLEITPDRLSRLVGTPNCPTLVDVRVDEDFSADPRLIPGSRRRSHTDLGWIEALHAESVIVICQQGRKLSHGVAAWLRHHGVAAEVLEGGFEAWAALGLACIPVSRLPQRDERGRTVWVTRSRPKIDRIACPWLLRRFVDPEAVILFVAPSEVEPVADRFMAEPFDIDADIFWSHRGDLCTFDVMVEELDLGTEAMKRLATIVRGADTSRPDLAPEVPGFLAASLGLSRMFNDDLEQLEAGMVLYDAFYRWCRDATGETHNWPTSRKAP